MNAYLNKYTSPIFTAYASCGLCHGKMSDLSVRLSHASIVSNAYTYTQNFFTAILVFRHQT